MIIKSSISGKNENGKKGKGNNVVYVKINDNWYIHELV